MAESRKQVEIARCLNELSACNLNKIGREDHFRDIINDYFCNDDVEINDSSDFSESDAETNDASQSTHPIIECSNTVQSPLGGNKLNIPSADSGDATSENTEADVSESADGK